jgi:CheY-like chemotaxis protein
MSSPISDRPKDVLIVAANPTYQRVISTILGEKGHRTFVCASLQQCRTTLQPNPTINIVVMVLDLVSPASLQTFMLVREMFAPFGQLPVFILIPISAVDPSVERQASHFADLVFGFPLRIENLERTINKANHILGLRGRGVSVEIEHDCACPVLSGCTLGSEPTSIVISDMVQRPHRLKAAFVPMLLADYIFRHTSAEKPERLDTILRNIFLSDFYSYWLREERITRRWLITNFSRLKEAVEQICDDSEGALSLESILASETYPGKTTVYYSQIPWHLSHKKGGRECIPVAVE